MLFVVIVVFCLCVATCVFFLPELLSLTITCNSFTFTINEFTINCTHYLSSRWLRAYN